MGYKVEFDDSCMRWADYSAVMQYEGMRLPWSFVEELMDYVQGLGYDWYRVAFVWKVAA